MAWEIDHVYFDVTLINERGQLVSGSSFLSLEDATEKARSLASSINPLGSAPAPAQSGADLLEELGL